MMNPLAKKTVLGLGELLWDCFGDQRRSGGAPANVAFHAAQLGATGVIVSRLGQDELGHELVAYLEKQGLSTQWIQRDPQHPTGTVTVHTDSADHPQYTIHEDVAWDHLEYDENLSVVLNRADAICFGSLAQRSPQSRQTIRQCLETKKTALRVFDVNLRPPWVDKDILEASLNHSDVVKLNDEEVAPVATLLDITNANLDAFVEALMKRYALRVVCITRAEKGCLLFSGNERVEAPGRAVTVADAVGAGDAFTAALVCGLLSDWPLQSIANFANQVGALVASHPGATPVLRDDYQRLIQSHS